MYPAPPILQDVYAPLPQSLPLELLARSGMLYPNFQHFAGQSHGGKSQRHMAEYIYICHDQPLRAANGQKSAKYLR
jgi:hypothetical protein